MFAASTNLLLLGAVLPPLVLACLATFVIRRWAPRWGLVDQPAARKVHTTPTPLGGGLGIWFGVVTTFGLGQLALAIVAFQPGLAEWVPEAVRPHLAGLQAKSGGLWGLLAGGTVLVFLGLTDDKRGLPWQLRLVVQFAVAAGCVAWLGLRLTAFIGIPAITFGLSVVWIVALINSFNMLDNMDGLSAGIGTISASVLAAVLLLAPDPQTHRPQLFVVGYLLVLVGGLLGFLFHNRPPARIFMGDAGSYFLGFYIATATLLATYAGYQSPTPHAIFAPVCVMAVPLYDMTTVLWIRIREGRSPFQADKCHLSHRLVDLGLTKVQAVLTIYLLTLTCGLGALLLHRVDLLGACFILLLIVCLLTLIAILESTARRKLAELKVPAGCVDKDTIVNPERNQHVGRNS
ncbi:MAG TPA: MraY family glycosyltransferase [Pirellulaceae bacterium]|nr:MraY family glycosyltransferase [Pirellulaceae bacterium]